MSNKELAIDNVLDDIADDRTPLRILVSALYEIAYLDALDAAIEVQESGGRVRNLRELKALENLLSFTVSGGE